MLLLSFPFFCLQAGAARCESANQHPQFILFEGTAFPLSRQLSDAALDWKVQTDGIEVLRLRETGTDKEMGAIEYVYDLKSRVLDAENVQVSTGYKRNGVGQLLFQALHEKYPEIQEIRATLAADNFTSFIRSAYAGYNLLGAVKRTALFKQNEIFGFTRVEIRDTDNILALKRREQVEISLHRRQP